MKRTTIMLDEDLLYDLQQIAQQKGAATSAVIREALSVYVTRQYETAPPENPLLALIGLGKSAETTDVSDGRDEDVLSEAIDPISGWSV